MSAETNQPIANEEVKAKTPKMTGSAASFFGWVLFILLWAGLGVMAYFAINFFHRCLAYSTITTQYYRQYGAYHTGYLITLSLIIAALAAPLLYLIPAILSGLKRRKGLTNWKKKFFIFTLIGLVFVIVGFAVNYFYNLYFHNFMTSELGYTSFFGRFLTSDLIMMVVAIAEAFLFLPASLLISGGLAKPKAPKEEKSGTTSKLIPDPSVTPFFKKPSFYVYLIFTAIFVAGWEIIYQSASSVMAAAYSDLGPVEFNLAGDTAGTRYTVESYFGGFFDVLDILLFVACFGILIYFLACVLSNIRRRLMAKNPDKDYGFLKFLRNLVFVVAFILSFGVYIYDMVLFIVINVFFSGFNDESVRNTCANYLNSALILDIFAFVAILLSIIFLRLWVATIFNSLPKYVRVNFDEDGNPLLDDFDATPGVTHDDYQRESDALTANKQQLGTLTQEQLPTISELVKDFMAFSAYNGLKFDEKNATRLFASLAASRLLFVRGLSDYEQKKLTKILGDFFGGGSLGYSELPERKAFVDSLSKAIDGCNRRMLFLGLYGCQGDMFNDENSDLLPLLYDASTSHPVVGLSKDVHLSPNLYALAFLKEGDNGMKASRRALRHAFIVNLLVNDVENEPKADPFPMGPYDFAKVVSAAADREYLEEDVWKKIDSYESFVNSKKNFIIRNDTRNSMENAVGVSLSGSYDSGEALDEAFSHIIFPSSLALLGNDEDLLPQISIIFGEGTLPGVNKIYEDYLAAKAAPAEVKEPAPEENVPETEIEAGEPTPKAPLEEQPAPEEGKKDE
ncbi:MAG: hypothetical protein Q4F15_06345 [Bacillota bacterium]|nr:hypothetical protein [Bacillota bacterium]